jgi:hypothetical protein
MPRARQLRCFSRLTRCWHELGQTRPKSCLHRSVLPYAACVSCIAKCCPATYPWHPASIMRCLPCCAAPLCRCSCATLPISPASTRLGTRGCPRATPPHAQPWRPSSQTPPGAWRLWSQQPRSDQRHLGARNAGGLGRSPAVPLAARSQPARARAVCSMLGRAAVINGAVCAPARCVVGKEQGSGAMRD